MAFLFTGKTNGESMINILKFWQNGMWDPALLVFAVQMMLILVLGHVLVLTRPVSWITEKLTSIVKDNASAVVMVSVSTMLVAFFNWGLGLIFGAIMARKVGEAARDRGFKINYPLVGAAGYVGLMVWHGGISGSAPLKAAESGHIKSLFSGKGSENLVQQLPDSIPTETTIFADWNLILFGVLLVLVPMLLWVVSKKTETSYVELLAEKEIKRNSIIEGAEKLDHSKYLSLIFGILLITAFLFSYGSNLLAGNLTPNMLNFFMLGL
ncbi:hypothetical protein GCM10011532_22040 [Christiangramia forsetii]|nr:hypothetical protein GCM10011532_22040 [Christiangramia forsetii]